MIQKGGYQVGQILDLCIFWPSRFGFVLNTFRFSGYEVGPGDRFYYFRLFVLGIFLVVTLTNVDFWLFAQFILLGHSMKITR